MMTAAYEIDEHQIRKDDDQVKMLAVFHFILAGFGLLGLLGIGMHYLFMSMFFSNPAMMRGPNGAAMPGPPQEVFQIFMVVYMFAGCSVLIGMLGNAASGYFLLHRKHRMFSLVIAGLNCMQFPFGTVLGVFTFIVLMRESVRQSYLNVPQQ